MSKQLFQEFNKVSSKEWKQKIQADLKGLDYQSLITKTLENIDIKPFYHYDDYKAMLQLAPQKFKIGQNLKIIDADVARKIAAKALKNGADIFIFHFDQPFDPKTLLRGLDPSKLIFKADILEVTFLKELFETTKGQSQILIDPIGHFARFGNWFINETSDFEQLKKLQNYFPENYRFIEISSYNYKNAGANITQELAYSLNHAVEYIEKLGETISAQIQFGMANGSNYFFEIAKLKALRYLWPIIGQSYYQNVQTYIYAEPSLRDKTIFDPYVNLLRTGMEMMSAILGGCDIAANMPFDNVYKKTNAFSERLARNQLIILQKEAGFNQALESTKGDYFLEEMTYKLAEKALDIFKQIEKSGGFLAQLYKGKIQQKIAETAQKEQSDFDEGKIVLVGTNKYINKNEEVKDIEIYPFLKKRSGQTLIRPIVPKRLAEKLESQRLMQLGHKL